MFLKNLSAAFKSAVENTTDRPTAQIIELANTNYYYTFSWSPYQDLSGIPMAVVSRELVESSLLSQLAKVGTIDSKVVAEVTEALDYLYRTVGVISLVAGDLVALKQGQIGILTLKKPVTTLQRLDPEHLKKDFTALLDAHWDSGLDISRDLQTTVGSQGGLIFTLFRNPAVEAVCNATPIERVEGLAILKAELLKLRLEPTTTLALFESITDYLTQVHGCRFMRGPFPGLGFYCVGYQGAIRFGANGTIRK